MLTAKFPTLGQTGAVVKVSIEDHIEAPVVLQYQALILYSYVVLGVKFVNLFEVVDNPKLQSPASCAFF